MTAAGPLGRRELLWAAAGLLFLAVVQYLPYAFKGGIYTDDYLWIFRQDNSILAAAATSISLGYRSLDVAMTAMIGRFLGGDRPWMYLPSVLLVMTQSLALFAVLRSLRVGGALAFACAAMLTALPWVDATRLWMTMAHQEMAVTVWLVGLLIAIAGLRADTPRRRRRMGALSIVVYVWAILFYEGVAGPIAISSLVYLCVASPRRALTRGAVDVLVVSLGVIKNLSASRTRGSNTDFEAMGQRVSQLWHAWWRIVELSVPVEGVFWGPIGVVVLIAAAFGAGRALAGSARQREVVIRASAMAGIGLAMALSGLVVFVPAVPIYTPAFQGADNRFGVIAAAPAVVMFAGVTLLVAIGLTTLARRLRLAPATAAAALLVLVLAFAVRERHNQAGWIEAARAQDRVMGAIGTAFGGPPPRDSRVITVNHPNFTQVHAPVFTTTSDLTGEIRRRWGNRGVAAHPFELPLRCDTGQMAFNTSIPGFPPFSYGTRLYIVDVPTATVIPVYGRGVCLRVAAALEGRPEIGSPPPWQRLAPRS